MYFKKCQFLLILLLFLMFCGNQALYTQTNSDHVYVKGHFRNGTWVDGHYRTAPNSTNQDNFSTLGNTNPYTGSPGYIPSDGKPRNRQDQAGQTRTYRSSGSASSHTTYESYEEKQFRMGSDNFRNENYRAAEANFNTCIKSNRSNGYAWFMRGYSRLNHYHEVLDSYYANATTLEHLLEGAYSDTQKALDLIPNGKYRGWSWMNLSLIYHIQGKFDASTNAIEKAVIHDYEINCSSHQLRALNYWFLFNDKEALWHWRMAKNQGCVTGDFPEPSR